MGKQFQIIMFVSSQTRRLYVIRDIPLKSIQFTGHFKFKHRSPAQEKYPNKIKKIPRRDVVIFNIICFHFLFNYQFAIKTRISKMPMIGSILEIKAKIIPC